MTRANCANLSIDAEIANSLDHLNSSYSPETFAINAKIIKRMLKHHSAVLKENASVTERHGKMIFGNMAQIDDLITRVEMLEEAEKAKERAVKVKMEPDSD